MQQYGMMPLMMPPAGMMPATMMPATMMPVNLAAQAPPTPVNQAQAPPTSTESVAPATAPEATSATGEVGTYISYCNSR